MSRFKVGSSSKSLSRRYREYISSAAWWKKRNEKIEAVGGECERCGSNEQLEVHHKTYERLCNEKLEDLEVVCNPCHFKQHSSMGALLDDFFRRMTR